MPARRRANEDPRTANHTNGVTDVFSTGSRWAPPKGDVHTVTNSGSDVAQMWVYQLIEKGEGDGAM